MLFAQPACRHSFIQVFFKDGDAADVESMESSTLENGVASEERVFTHVVPGTAEPKIQLPGATEELQVEEVEGNPSSAIQPCGQFQFWKLGGHFHLGFSHILVSACFSHICGIVVSFFKDTRCFCPIFSESFWRGTKLWRGKKISPQHRWDMPWICTGQLTCKLFFPWGYFTDVSLSLCNAWIQHHLEQKL